METLQAGRSDPWYMLDNAHTCLQMLATAADAVRADGCAARPVRVRAHAADSYGWRQPAATSSRPPTSASVRPTLAPRAGAAAPRRPIRSSSASSSRKRAKSSRRSSGISRLGAEPARARRPRHHPPLVPHAEGQRPHGRRARAQRVRVVHREPAQPAARQHASRARRRSSSVLRDAVAALPQLVDQLETGRAPQIDTAASSGARTRSPPPSRHRLAPASAGPCKRRPPKKKS